LKNCARQWDRGEMIPIYINPKPMVNDKPPEEEEVKEAARKLKSS
jgi:hypothetical protein